MTFLASARPPLAQAFAVGLSPLVAMVHFPSSPADAAPARRSETETKAPRERKSERDREKASESFTGWRVMSAPGRKGDAYISDDTASTIIPWKPASAS